MVTKTGLVLLISLVLLASCHGVNDDTKDLIDVLQGKPKRDDQLGTLFAKSPNNIGNTFTADPKTTRTITWQSGMDTGEVIIGNDRYPSTSVMLGDMYFHRVDLTGLEPGKTYRYIVGTVERYSPIYSFKTESPNYPDGFSIIHITDPQIGTSKQNVADAVVWKRVIEAAVKKCPGAVFVANTGDVVEKTEDETKRISFYFDYAQEVLAKNAFVYSMGNNDLLEWYNRYFYIADNRNDDSSGVLYSFDYGNVHFISINLVFPDTFGDDVDDEDLDFALSTEQLDWLENDLKNAQENPSTKWKVVMTHKPDFGKKKSENINPAVPKLFDAYNVNLVLAGHYHFYMRSKPINWEGNNKANGTVWTIPNAAGTKYNSRTKRDYSAIAEQPNLPMFSVWNFTATNFSFISYTVDSNGNAVQYDKYTY